MTDEYIYETIVGRFRKLTNRVSPESKRCCINTTNGVPHCSHTVACGIYGLTFTQKEMAVLGGFGPIVQQGLVITPIEDCYYCTSGDYEKVAKSLHTGLIADTLESASHPTRPIIRDGEVIGVATVTDCIAEYDMEYLKSNADELYYLWYRAVKHFGVKPYYLTGTYDPKKYITL